ncbi:hypothetical protein DICPUDRAFT_49381 [Dictyostelium purpureum]|uniref:Uncharacterized protein n=1 Tax=Dictyostelium purpureum TaxID=5786 RepID=F0ZTI8_DICPU|nr:uncharacterized protein DICPUDRAFT_49381 [Dictyostelium purpureum]EGC32733.1 hypothetical protein DICPUDRAFT_49381 [Dictyostelium purpureum]|eukprot:XP_003290731.1 hypothetical protein DICPUDRAFT_49381 [Dictyostelium purpureum]
MIIVKFLSIIFILLNIFIFENVQSQTITNFVSNPDISQLQYDQSYLRVISNVPQEISPNTTLHFEYVYDACVSCSYQLLVELNSTNTNYFIMPSTFGYKFNVSILNNGVNTRFMYLSFYQKFNEYGVYDLSVNISSVNKTTKLFHSVNILSKEYNPNIPIAVMFSILTAMAIVWPMILYLYKRSKRDSLEYQLISSVERENNKKKDRLKSLDVFRGFSITIMIFVNYGGGGYWFFNHSYWNGLTVADLVFPWFVFIMGIAMPLSFNAMERRGTTKLVIVQKLVRRSAILFALGLFINNGVNLQHWRILGVLQRFAISYLIVGLIMLFVPLWRFRPSPSDINLNIDQQQHVIAPLDFNIDPAQQQSINNNNNNNNNNNSSDKIYSGKNNSFINNYLADLAPYWIQWLVALLLLAGWFLLMFLVPVPGCPKGYLGPGGIGDNSLYPNCTGGAARLIDMKIFTNNHIFQSPTCQDIYKTSSYDPEGTVGYLTSIFICFIGVQAGRIILIYKSNRSRLIRWMVWSAVCCGIAAGLCGLSQNDGVIPINKNLWSPSFVFLMAGFGFFVLTIMFIVIDIKKIWNGSPFIYVGMNPITIYCGHEILGGYFPFSFSVEYQTHSLYLLSNCIGVGCWLLIAYLMFLNKVFINI